MRRIATLLATALALLAAEPSTAQGAANRQEADAPGLPFGRWWMGVEVGYVAWGRDAACGCSSARAAVGSRYAYERGPLAGAGAGLVLAYQATRFDLVNTQLELTYFPRVLGDRMVGVVVAGGPSLLLDRRGYAARRHRGRGLDLGVRLQGPGGARGRTRVTLDAGVTSQWERFEERRWGWSGETVDYRIKTTGLRLTLGLQF